MKGLPPKMFSGRCHMNLLFSVDRRVIPCLLNCLRSIALRGGAGRCQAYILHSDLTGEDMARVGEGAPETVTLHFTAVPENLFADFPETDRYPRQIYYRLAAPLLLPPELTRVLYLDVDTIIINSLAPLYEAGFDGNLFMACTHTNDALTRLNRVRLGLDPDSRIPYINTGVMMMNLPLLRRELDMADIRSYAEEKRHALMLPDQDILTALYGDKVKLLDAMIYNLSDRTLTQYNANPKHEKRDVDWVRRNSVVIHYLGKNKPWLPGYWGVLDVFYREILSQTAF